MSQHGACKIYLGEGGGSLPSMCNCRVREPGVRGEGHRDHNRGFMRPTEARLVPRTPQSVHLMICMSIPGTRTRVLVFIDVEILRLGAIADVGARKVGFQAFVFEWLLVPVGWAPCSQIRPRRCARQYPTLNHEGDLAEQEKFRWPRSGRLNLNCPSCTRTRKGKKKGAFLLCSRHKTTLLFPVRKLGNFPFISRKG